MVRPARPAGPVSSAGVSSSAMPFLNALMPLATSPIMSEILPRPNKQDHDQADDDPVPNTRATHGDPPLRPRTRRGVSNIETGRQPRDRTRRKQGLRSGRSRRRHPRPDAADTGSRTRACNGRLDPRQRDLHATRPRRGSAATKGARAGRSPAGRQPDSLRPDADDRPAPSARCGCREDAERADDVAVADQPGHLVEIAEEAGREEVRRAAGRVFRRALLDDPARCASARCGRRCASPPRDRA